MVFVPLNLDIYKAQEIFCRFMAGIYPTIPQVRMTRRLDGACVLDDNNPHKNVDTSIGLTGDWRKRGPVFAIPFEALYGNEVKNLIAAGRCISVTDSMWDITRVIPRCAVRAGGGHSGGNHR